MISFRDFDNLLYDFVREASLHNFFNYLTPVNLDLEKEFFFRSFRNPSFKYVSLPVSDWFVRLYKLRDLLSDVSAPEPLRVLFAEKIDEFELLLKLLKARGSPEFSVFSRSLFGRPSLSDFLLARLVLFLPDSFRGSSLDLSTLYFLFTDYSVKKGFDGWSLSFSDNLVSSAFVDNLARRIVVNSSLSWSEKSFLSLLEHELGVHARRFLSANLKILSFGAAKYELLEEGLATFREFVVSRDFSVLKYSALKFISVYYAERFDFLGVFNKLRGFVSDEEAFRLALRAKRGAVHGAFTKDIVYWAGFLRVLPRFFYFNKYLRFGKLGFHHYKKPLLEVLSHEAVSSDV